MENQNHSYMMLGRLQSDCEYFLNHGNRCERHLYYLNVDEHIDEMIKLHNELLIKPEWLSMSDILKYKEQMK